MKINNDLKIIGKGRTRKVYELSKTKILKQLTYDPGKLGIDDVNRIEYNLYINNKDRYIFLARCYSYNANTRELIMEKLDCDYIKNLVKKYPIIRSKYNNNLLEYLYKEKTSLFYGLMDFDIKDVENFCKENNLMPEEITNCHQWGIDAMGHIRLVDYNR